MKKLIAISMMIALVAGAAFAQEVSVGAALEFNWTLADQSSPMTMKTGMQAAKLNFRGANDEGTFGGHLTFNILGLSMPGGDWQRLPLVASTDQSFMFKLMTGRLMDRVFIWWQPVDQLKLQFGRDNDGIFNPTGVTRWGWHQGSVDVRTSERWGAEDAILGNWGNFGLSAVITPIDNLTINFAIALPDPTFGDNGAYYVGWTDKDDINAGTDTVPAEFGKAFERMQLQVGYNVDGIGQFWGTFQAKDAGDRIGLSYHTSSLLDGLALEAGFSYKITSGANNAFNFTAGADYNAGDWGAKVRFLINGFDKFTVSYVDLMPYYDFGFLKAFLNIQINSLTDNAKFVINPYVTKNIGGGQVGAGIMYDTSNDSWSFKTGLKISF